ncbi:MAG: hypothetical protein R3E48_18740 [Burkholderiaceae bacterium]
MNGRVGERRIGLAGGKKERSRLSTWTGAKATGSCEFCAPPPASPIRRQSRASGTEAAAPIHDRLSRLRA